jgi:acetyl-CoA carboxylase carboxyl transferase subunit alpha
MEYLDFELPIKDIVEQLDKCKIIGNESEIDVTDTCDQLEKKLIEARTQVENLTIHSVVPQSEQLFCYHEGSYTLNEDGTCCKCHRLPKPKTK